MRFGRSLRSIVVVVVVVGLGLPACRRMAVPLPSAADGAEGRGQAAPERPDPLKHRGPPHPAAVSEPYPLRRCFAGQAPGDRPRPLGALLDRAAERFDHHDYAQSLACAEEAARQEPRSVEAHHDRAAALVELGRIDLAQLAFTRALALDPDDPETLAGAADLYINHLEPTNDHTEIGLELARRGARRLKHRRDRHLAARLALLSGQALNDLGRSREALPLIDQALVQMPDDLRARYERGIALFELCRFDEAKRSFAELVERTPDDAWAQHHLGLALERLGDQNGAEQALARARALDPSNFPPPVILPPDEFQRLVNHEVAQLGPEASGTLSAVVLEVADLPDVADLKAEDPPLSPTILGLFRGTPLGEAPGGDGPRTIVLYRKNLGRAVTTREELMTQVRTTLLHELGHLHGEDDAELRARGLE